MSIKTIILKASEDVKNELLKIEGKITTGSAAAIEDVTKLVNTVQTYASKAEGVIPALTTDLTGPLGTLIAGYVPGGEADRTAIVAVINDFTPFLQKAASPAVAASLIRGLSAEILTITNKAITDINVAVRDITYFEQEVTAA